MIHAAMYDDFDLEERIGGAGLPYGFLSALQARKGTGSRAGVCVPACLGDVDLQAKDGRLPHRRPLQGKQED